MQVVEVAPGVHRVTDTCNVYLIEAPGERTAIAIDFGSGLVLDAAAAIGLRITDVLMTHHHRDQAQGLPLAVAAGIRIHVPPVEVELFSAVERMWASRQLVNEYDTRQSRFSLLESVPVTSTVPEYRTAEFGGVRVLTVPTPGHTVGSVSYLVDLPEGRCTFTGDLIYAPGKVWSLAATQWSYSHHEGPAMTVLSALLLTDHEPGTLLPSHGEPMPDGAGALVTLAAAMQDYVDSRRPTPWDLTDRLRHPWQPITDHLLLNRTSLSCSYALLSATGEALLIDYGYDMTTGLPLTSERAARRPWLASLPALADFGVTAVTVALPTHYHDDHVGGMPLLRDVTGAELWIPSTVASVLADPLRYDLPCQWYDPIPADRILPVGEPFAWHEYTITAHEQPGHTMYAVAYELEVDGTRVLFTGDQQPNLGVPGAEREVLNYQYRNRFRLGDFVASAELYRRVAPGLLASGHWAPKTVDAAFLDMLAEEGAFTDAIHRRLLPDVGLVAPVDGVFARIVPYRSASRPGATLRLEAEVINPFEQEAEARVELVLPTGWAPVQEAAVHLPGAGSAVVAFEVAAPPTAVGRLRIAADVTIGTLRLGQAAEAFVDVEPAG